MMSNRSFIVPAESLSVRLDVFLTQQWPEAPSRVYIQRLIDGGHVQVNQKKVKSSYKVIPGDKIDLEGKLQSPASDIQPEHIPLNIFYEDPWLLVVHKPVGMLVHPVHGHHGGTLVNGLMYHCQQLSDVNIPDEEEGFLDPALVRPGIVHRLDRETSGLLVVAKDNQTHVKLAKQFEKHQVQKKYLAIVKGNVKFDEGLIDAPLGRHPKAFDKKAVVYGEKSKAAVTVYRVIRRFGDQATLVGLYPKSGRTHQLRVHMAHINHPILGDDKYGDAKSFSRLALHAQGLGFTHPQLNTFMEFSTAVPEKFQNPRLGTV